MSRDPARNSAVRRTRDTVIRREPERAWSELELKAAAHDRMRELEAGGAHLDISRQDQDYAFGVGLRMLTLRDLVTEGEGGLFRPQPDSLDVLAYYANAIEHLAAGNGAEAAAPAASPSAVVRT